MDDLNAVVQTLTDGLSELPTDDGTRVKHFLAEYLGDPEHPVPFGGRGKDFARLDAGLADRQAPPYTLLAAPAGRGKSALLLRWCQSLLTRSDLAVVYFPVSIRFRTNLAGTVFPALVALLARLHGEKLPTDPHTPEEVWRGLLTEYMTRPLPGGRTLVLVLDGVDEAADWAAGPDLFPEKPPPGLRVVLSARYLANDQDANAWLKRLGWAYPGLARTLELYPLDRAGIASVLLQMGFPVDLLSTRVDIVSELHRLSEGDPLLIRLYVDDLWARGEAALRLQPEDLHAIHPGLVGYFERWWNDQRLLWSRDAPQREIAVQSVLNLLAGALGPLSQADILNLAPREAGLNTENLAQYLEPLARFVIGDGTHQGYVFSHPRLASYFLEERLSSQERQEVEHRFLAWGAQTLADLNEERLPPAHASPYIVQYYGAHLERAQASASALLTLVSNGWRRAWERLDRANAGFLGDSERAWRAAERENTVATESGQPAPYLGAEIRSLLCRVSVNSMTSNISPRLMLEAVKTGVWTPAQGLANLRLIADAIPRARELVGLAPSVREPLRSDILQEALDTLATIKDERTRLDALVELAPGFSEELLGQILANVSAIADEADRAGMLAELAPAISAYPALVARALKIAQEIEEEEYLALALTGLAPAFSTQQQESGLQLVLNIRDERYRTQALTAMIPSLPAALLQTTLSETSRMWDSLSQTRLLAELANYLPGQLQIEARQETLKLMREIIDQEFRVELFVRLAPCLQEGQFQQALQEIQALWDESYRAQALSDLLPHLPAEQLPAFLSTVQMMKNEGQRTAVLLQLPSLLPETLQEQIIEIIQATWDEGLRAELLARLAPTIAEPLLPRLLELIQAIQDPGYRIWLLAELGTSLSGKLSARPFDIMQIFHHGMGDPEERLQTLLAIVPRLSDEALTEIFVFMLPEIFGFRWSTQNVERQAQILSKLGPRLPASWLPRAMSMIQTLGNESHQVQMLVAMAPRIREGLLPRALEIVRAMKDREMRAQVLEALVSSLPEEHRGERVREMLQVLQLIKDEDTRAHTATIFATAPSTTFPAEQMQTALQAITAMHTEWYQARVLAALASHTPETMFEEILLVLHTMRGEETRAKVLEALAPHIPDQHLAAFLAAVQAIQHERWRVQVLASMVSVMPQERFASIVRLVQDIPSEGERVDVLRALAPHTPEASFAQLWSAIQHITEAKRRVWVLGSLTIRVPEEFFPQLWEAIQEIEDEGWQLRTLAALAPHMSNRFFALLWQAVQEIKGEARRMRVISILAQYVPEHLFWEVFRTAQSLTSTLTVRADEMRVRALESQQQVNALEALAERVPESLFPQLWQAVSEMQDPWRQDGLQVRLAARVPEHCFALVWETVLKTEDTWQKTRLLMALIPCVPDSFFPRFWETVKTLESQMKQFHILNALIPYLSPERQAGILSEIHTVPYPQERMELLETLIPYLSEKQCVEVLEMLQPPQPENQQREHGEAAWEAQQSKQRTRILAALTPRLPEEQFLALWPTLLQTARQTRSDEVRVWILTWLAARHPKNVLPELLELLWSIKLQGGQEKVLAALLPALEPGGWREVLALATANMRATGETRVLVQLLKAVGALAQPPSPSLLYPALHDLLHRLAQNTRPEALADLTPLAATIRALGGEAAIREACCAVLEVGYWWP